MIFSSKLSRILAVTGTIFTCMTSFSSTPALADIAFAQDAYGNVYQCRHSSSEEAQRCVLSYCRDQSGRNCNLVRRSANSTPRPTGCINPATGLPMTAGTCSGVDVMGNPYGIRLK